MQSKTFAMFIQVHWTNFHHKKVLLCIWWWWNFAGTFILKCANQDKLWLQKCTVKNVILELYTAKPHCARLNLENINELWWKVLHQPAYLTEIATSNFHVVSSTTSGNKFERCPKCHSRDFTIWFLSIRALCTQDGIYQESLHLWTKNENSLASVWT